MATVVPVRFRNNSGEFDVVEMDIDWIVEINHIPEGHEFSIKMIDVTEAAETTDFIGPRPKK